MGSLKKISLLLIMMVLIGFSYLHELEAVPVSRTQSLAGNAFSGGSNSQMFQEDKWELEVNDQFFHGRSDIENQDYPGTGANHSHEPGGGSKSPGRNP